MDTPTSPSIIRFDRSLRNKSTTLKQINCNITAIEPQTIISMAFTLDAKHTARGIAIPMHAPKREIDAAILPFLINSNSFIGVTFVYTQSPERKIPTEIMKCDIKNGNPLLTLCKIIKKNSILVKFPFSKTSSE